MDQRHRFDAVLALAQRIGQRGFRKRIGLKPQKARDHLKIVLHPVMHLPEQNLFFRKRRSQPVPFVVQGANQPDLLRRPRNRRCQTFRRDTILHQVVLRARLHRVHRRLLVG